MRTSLLATAMICGVALALPAYAQTNAPSSNPTAPSDSKPASAAANTPGAPPAPGAPTAVPPGPPPAPTPAPAEVAPPAPPPPPPPVEAAPPPAPPAADTTPAEPAPKPKPKPRMMMGGAASNITPANTRSDIAPRLPSPKLGPNAGPVEYLGAAKSALKAHRTGEAQEALEMAETRVLDRSTAVDDAGRPNEGPMVTHIRAALDSLAKKDMAGADAAIDAAMGGKTPMAEGRPHMMHHMHMKKTDAPPPT